MPSAAGAPAVAAGGTRVPPGERALQLLFPGFRFGADDPRRAERLAAAGVGGFCLYGGTPRTVASLVARLQARARIPLLFCADYEEGTASHVRGGTRLPPNMALGAAGREALAYQKALITAVEARAMGVRWVLAPVLDLATRSENPIVNVRAFGSDPGAAGRLGRAYLLGLRHERVLGCAKHFPGHGEAASDSHLTLPTLPARGAGVLERDLAPFRAVMAEADSMMLAHLDVRALGGGRGVPASLDPAAVEGLLRRRLGFTRLAVTDALDMRAVAGRMGDEEAARRALAAGEDVLLVPADPERLARALPRLASEPALRPRVEESFRRLGRAKAACGLFEDRGRVRPEELALVGARRHRLVAAELYGAGLAWVRPPKEPLREFRYVEPGAGGAKLRGGPFLGELRRCGVRLRSGGGAPVVGALFHGPRAYSGRIRPDAAERAALRRAFAGAPSGLLVSFGSPFVFDEIRGWRAGLCAFSPAEEAQRAAARAVAGRLEARGRVPVRLDCI